MVVMMVLVVVYGAGGSDSVSGDGADDIGSGGSGDGGDDIGKKIIRQSRK